MWEDPVAALRNEIRLACQGEVLKGEGFLFSHRINTKLLNIWPCIPLSPVSTLALLLVLDTVCCFIACSSTVWLPSFAQMLQASPSCLHHPACPHPGPVPHASLRSWCSTPLPWASAFAKWSTVVCSSPPWAGWFSQSTILSYSSLYLHSLAWNLMQRQFTQ